MAKNNISITELEKKALILDEKKASNLIAGYYAMYNLIKNTITTEQYIKQLNEIINKEN